LQHTFIHILFSFDRDGRFFVVLAVSDFQLGVPVLYLVQMSKQLLFSLETSVLKLFNLLPSLQFTIFKDLLVSKSL
jgi:hypothetical protein